MTTIHYALSDLYQVMNPSTDHGLLECAQTMRRAIEIAGRICSRMDENTSEDPILTADRFITDLHFEGRCRGSEPISYGWTKDLDPPTIGSCEGSAKPCLPTIPYEPICSFHASFTPGSSPASSIP